MPFNQPLQRFKAEFFKALAHPMRITILELLRQGEMTVSDLQERLAVDPSSLSQQLAVLRSRDIVAGRRAGSNVFYTVRDPAVFALLDIARTIFDNHLIEMQEMAGPGRDEAVSGRQPATPPVEVSGGG